VTIENLDKVVHAFFILYSHLFDIIFKTQIKHPDSYKPYVISFLFSVLLELQSKLSRGNTQQPEKKMRLMMLNTAGAALAVFCFFYILRGV
jgi:hypothetical protein